MRNLETYSTFIHKVRIYNKEYKDLTKAIDKSVDECISEGILVEFLTKMKSEVRNVLLEEFDEERAIKSWNYAMDKMQNEIKQYKNEIDNIRSEKEKNIIQTVSLLREIGKDDNFIIQALIEKYNISREKVSSYL